MPEENQENRTGNKPLNKFRCGAITATVWENNVTNRDGTPGSYMSVSLDRNYRDRDGNWKSTNSFRFADLPKARYVIDKAFEFITERRNANPPQVKNEQMSVEEENIR